MLLCLGRKGSPLGIDRIRSYSVAGAPPRTPGNRDPGGFFGWDVGKTSPKAQASRRRWPCRSRSRPPGFSWPRSPPASGGSYDLLLADVSALGLPAGERRGPRRGNQSLPRGRQRAGTPRGVARARGLAPARAATENAPPAAAQVEADNVLEELPEGGAPGGPAAGRGYFCAPWEPEGGAAARVLGGRGLGGLCAGARVVSFGIPGPGGRRGGA